MYSNIENVNILTGVLRRYGVRRVVACPGSRNAPIIHNLNEMEGITCYPVTDERSAGFVALGMALTASPCCPDPVAVCVTSGSALANLYPAVVEAYYQKAPMVIISADRPAAWIGQQDGQTFPQSNLFGSMVNYSTSLPEVTRGEKHDEQHWHCNRLANEALIHCCMIEKGPVHINIPISEPLYEFNLPELPKAHKIEYVAPRYLQADFSRYDLQDFLNAKKPMIVAGQMKLESSLSDIKKLDCMAVVLCEPTALSEAPEEPTDERPSWGTIRTNFDELIPLIEDNEDYQPDFILYIGGTLISKRLKQFLRKCKDAKVWRVSQEGDCVDTFMHLDKVIHADPDQLADALLSFDCQSPLEVQNFTLRWQKALHKVRLHAQTYRPPYSSMLAVKLFQSYFLHHSLDTLRHSVICYANSSAIRLGCIYARQYVFCNRGINGIEGSLSTAAGISLALSSEEPFEGEKTHRAFCIIGDLSFFYDQNALWNTHIDGSLRILLLNNGGGAIFGKFKGLKESAARSELVMAKHHTSAEGICKQNDILYMKVSEQRDLEPAIEIFCEIKSDRPVLLEVFTDIDVDNLAMERYYSSLKLAFEKEKDINKNQSS